MKNGIVIAGTLLVDKINKIDKYPQSGQLTQIKSIQLATGGNVPNVGVDLKKIDPKLDVFALGRVGEDGDGNYIIEVLKNSGLNVDFITKSKEEKTSFTDVMSVMGGERTFFTYAGACAEFGLEDFDFSKINAKMLHLGYFLLLEKVDNGDGLKILKKAQENGIKTSIDLVSENSDRYNLVVPCLKYTDNLILNELEAGKLVGIEPTKENIKDIAIALKKLGVKERVVIHLPEFAVCLSENGYTQVASLDLPKGYIKGATGAGDAFCAGTLYGIYNNFDDKSLLEFASMCAAVSLRTDDAVSGLMTKDEITQYCSSFNRKSL